MMYMMTHHLIPPPVQYCHVPVYALSFAHQCVQSPWLISYLVVEGQVHEKILDYLHYVMTDHKLWAWLLTIEYIDFVHFKPWAMCKFVNVRQHCIAMTPWCLASIL